ncbi:MAG TPA: hypothetical protein VI818_00105 [Candidatus Thermoplasmatota archaeon]|nr:hypothetical protein [Candidatus Thermoplasmatota archaeon]
MRPSRSDEGNSAIIGLLIGATMFIAVFGYIAIDAIESGEDIAPVSDADLEGVANSLAETVFSGGAGWYAGGACTVAGKVNAAGFEPEGVAAGRFGIGEEVCNDEPFARANLSFAKLTNIYNAKKVGDVANDVVDYPEAVDSLDLDEAGYDFHLRSWPVLPSVQQMLRKGYRDPYIHPLYIGDYASAVGATKAVQHLAGVVDGLDAITLYVHVTNNGSVSAMFGVNFEIRLDAGNVDFTLHSRELAPGASQNLTYQIRKTSDWEWADAAQKFATYTISDVDDAFQTGTIAMPMIMTHLLTQPLLVVEADKLYFKLSGGNVNAKIHYASYAGDGKGKSFSDWTLRVDDGLGLPVATYVLPNSQKGFESRTFTSAGTYTSKLLNDALLLVWNSDIINVVADDPEPFGGSAADAPQAPVAEEIRYVDAILESFEANVFDAAYTHALVPFAAGGDVYPDVKSVMDNDLPLVLTDENGDPTLSQYNAIFVGSNVDHNAMTSSAAKDSIRDWVFEGGTLVVFGSDAQNVQWLQPLFHSALETANGGLSASDEQHPSLHVPNQLDWDAYGYSTEWGYNSGSDAYFTHVVSAGEEGDVLGVSDSGSFGAGRILLSAWRPYDLVPDQSTLCPADLSDATECQPIFLVHNLVTLAYRQLYIDFGPELPQDAPVGSVTRIASVYHPDLEQTVTVAVQVFVFEGSG